MSSKSAPEPEDDFASRLARYDEELAAGRDAPKGQKEAEKPTDLGTDERRVEKAKPVLHMLENLWPRTSKSPRKKKRPRFPQEFGRFIIKEELGRGGFGVVFKAYDPLLERDVALKMPRPEVLVSPVLADRFFAEARTSAALAHAHIGQIHEAGEIGPTCYIVSELCDGPNLAEWLEERKEPVDYRWAARLVAVLAEATAYAQQELGVLHRDIKPSNVLLFPFKDRAAKPPTDVALLGVNPKLTDFGLAKVLEEKSGEDTVDQEIVGTPEYMAPEQKGGDSEKICPATDVFALGTVLYEVLTGKPLFSKSSLSKSPAELFPIDPSALRRSRQDIPPDLEAICLRCLEKVPGDRYENAAHLGEDLRRFLAGMPTQARPLSLLSRMSKLTRRRPTESLLVIVIVVFLAVAGIGAWQHQSTVTESIERIEEIEKVTQEQLETAEVNRRRVLDLEYVGDIRQASQAFETGDAKQCVDLLMKHIPSGLEPDRRGFEWYRLWRLTHQEKRVLSGASGNLYQVCYSPDGQFLLAACADGPLMRWKQGAQDPTFLPARHRGDVNAVTYTADGRHILSGGDDTTIQVLDAEGNLLRKLRGHSRGIRSLGVMSTNQPWVVSTAMEPTVKLWNYETGETIRSWTIEGKDVELAFFSSDGNQVGIGCTDGSVFVFESSKSDAPRLLGKVGGSISAGAFLPGSQSLVVGGNDHQLTVLDVTTGEVLRRWRAHADWIYSLAISPDGTWCATVGKDHVAKIWSLADGKLLGRLVAHQGRLWGVAIHPNGEEIATCGEDRLVRLWSKKTVGENPVVTELPSEPLTMVPGHEPGTVAVGCRGGELEIVNVSTRKVTHSTTLENSVTGLSVDADGEIATATQRDHVHVLKEKGNSFETIRDIKDASSCAVAWSPDESKLGICASNGDVELIDMKGKEPPRQVHAHKLGTRLVFSPDSRHLVTFSYDSTAKIWDAAKLILLSSITDHERHINGASFDPTSKKVVLAGGDSTVGVYSVPDGKLIKKLHGPTDEVQAVSFSQNGRTIIGACRDGIIQMWNSEALQEIYSARTGLKSITTMAYLNDGGGLVIGGLERETDRYVLVWWDVNIPVP